jgi:hypothetical protein
MDGTDRRELGPGEIAALDGERGLFIAKERGGLFLLDAAAGERIALAEEAEFLLYDAPALYYSFRDSDYEADRDMLILCRADVTRDEAWEFAWINLKDYEATQYTQYIEFGSPRVDGDMLRILLAGFSGTGYMYDGSLALTIDVSTGEASLNEDPEESDWFGVNKPFTSGSEGPFQGEGGDFFGWYVCPGEGGAPEIVLSEEDMAQCGLPDGPFYTDEAFADIRGIEYVDGALFFAVMRGPRNPEEDIGWREAYDFGGITVYRKDPASGKIEKLYAYDNENLRGG